MDGLTHKWHCGSVRGISTKGVQLVPKSGESYILFDEALLNRGLTFITHEGDIRNTFDITFLESTPQLGDELKLVTFELHFPLATREPGVIGFLVRKANLTKLDLCQREDYNWEIWEGKRKFNVLVLYGRNRENTKKFFVFSIMGRLWEVKNLQCEKSIEAQVLSPPTCTHLKSFSEWILGQSYVAFIDPEAKCVHVCFFDEATTSRMINWNFKTYPEFHKDQAFFLPLNHWPINGHIGLAAGSRNQIWISYHLADVFNESTCLTHIGLMGKNWYTKAKRIEKRDALAYYDMRECKKKDLYHRDVMWQYVT